MGRNTAAMKRGWNYDKVNSRFLAYVDGTEFLRTTTAATTLQLALTVTSSATLSSTFTMGADASPAGDFTLWGTAQWHRVWFDVDGDTNGAWYFGADDYGLLVRLYGDTSDYYVEWNPSGDTNGELYFGQDTKGIMTEWFGDTTSYYVQWNPSGDTNGAWYFGKDDFGVDVAFYGQTTANSMIWDASANALVLTAAGITMGVASKLVLPVKASGSATSGDFWLDTTDYLLHFYANGNEYTVTAT